MSWDFDFNSLSKTGEALLKGISGTWDGVTDFFGTGFSWADVGKNILTYGLGFAEKNASQIGSFIGSFSSSGSSYNAGGVAGNTHVTVGNDFEKLNAECAKYGLYYNSADGCIYDSVTKTMVFDATGKQIVSNIKLEELRKAYYNSSTGKNDIASQGWRGEYNKVTLLYWTFAGVV